MEFPSTSCSSSVLPLQTQRFSIDYQSLTLFYNHCVILGGTAGSCCYRVRLACELRRHSRTGEITQHVSIEQQMMGVVARLPVEKWLPASSLLGRPSQSAAAQDWITAAIAVAVLAILLRGRINPALLILARALVDLLALRS
jgi:hypothetical protein